MVKCWAPDCKHYNIRERCRFFSFPKEIKKRNKWIRLLRRIGKPGPNTFVCSCHFRDGIKNNGPEIIAHNEAKRARFQFRSPERRKRIRKKNTSICTLEDPLEITAPATVSTIQDENTSIFTLEDPLEITAPATVSAIQDDNTSTFTLEDPLEI